MQWAAVGLLSLLVFSLPSSVYAETFNGIVYNAPPYQNNAQLEYDSNLLGGLTNTVKLYDNTDMENIVSSLEEKNLEVLMGFDMNKINFSGSNLIDVKLNTLDNYIDIAKNHPNVKAIILEKDPIVYMSENRIIEIADYIESNGVSVGVAMAPDNWIKTRSLADHVSIVYVYAFDYWNGSSGFNAANNAINLYNDYENKYSNEIIFEFGFPTDGKAIGSTIPSLEQQKTFVDRVTNSGINYVYFSLTDDDNKSFKLGFENNNAEYHWGLLTEDRGDKQSRITDVSTATSELITAEKDDSQPTVLRVDVFATEPTGITLIDGENRIDFYVNEYLKIFYESENGYENISIVSQIENAVKYSFTPTPKVFAACDPNIDCEYVVNNDDTLNYLIAVIIGGIFAVFVLIKLKRHNRITTEDYLHPRPT